jgi:MoxR-like ATPase/Mg-chelatase subunit ChlD
VGETTSALKRLRAALDAAVVGQEEAKAGLTLALLAGEHAYLEGPPGCGKSLLAETAAAASGSTVAALRLHRDVGEAELLGDALLRREPGPRGERLRREVVPGALLGAEVWVLDDLGRAPGEALGPLLRMLSERRALNRPLPLATALATGAPPELSTYLDPLDPTQLDRFAVQIRMSGLLWGRSWKAAEALAARVGPGPVRAGLDGAELRALRERARRIPVDESVRASLVELTRRLAELAGREAKASITDRAFGRAALAVMRAHALSRGAARVGAPDLLALRYMLGRRVPEEVRSVFEALVAEVLSQTAAGLGSLEGGAAGLWPGEGGEAVPEADRGVAGEPTAELSRPASPGPARVDAAAAVEPLLRALEGRFERSRVERGDDPGGQPRGWRRLRRLDELFDGDPTEAVLYAEGRLPGTPRTARRERRARGGRVALLRDVSASMEGRLSLWAGEVVAGLVATARRHRIRVGYVEFNHAAERFRLGGAFFHRGYRRLLELAARRRAEGRTSYEAPLRLALAEFRGGPSRDRHVILLTDGVPVLGDPAVAEERQLAQTLGVKVHTVFLGLGECPTVLDEISNETGGLRFVARPAPGGRLHVHEREAAS